MYHPIVMHVLKSDQNARDKELRFILTEPLALVLMVPQISSSDQVSHKEDVLIIRKGVEHVYQEASSIHN